MSDSHMTGAPTPPSIPRRKREEMDYGGGSGGAASPTGAEQLIANAERAINGAHDAVIQHIDDMIQKLESVKKSVVVKKEGAVAQLKEFVNIAASGLETVRALEGKMEQLIKNHLQ